MAPNIIRHSHLALVMEARCPSGTFIGILRRKARQISTAQKALAITVTITAMLTVQLLVVVRAAM
jgi:hypothetical protein